MKKVFKSRIFLVILTVVICVSVTTYAVVKLQANEIGYKDGTVEDALDNLYSNPATKKFCKFVESDYGNPNNPLSIGSKYKCQLGAEDKDENGVIYRYFYILTLNNDNTVDLIMDRNITQGSSSKMLSWMDAMNFFDSNQVAAGLGTSIKSKWINVLKVGLPDAQAIANAVGNTGWNMADKNYDSYFCFGLKDQSSCIDKTAANKTAVLPYKWLFNYTQGCSAFGCDSITSLDSTEAKGYWTRDVIAKQKDSTGRAWIVYNFGGITYDPFTILENGVRPVITVLKSNLFQETTS